MKFINQLIFAATLAVLTMTSGYGAAPSPDLGEQLNNAARLSDITAVRIFINNGANVNHKNVVYGMTSLHYAALNRHVEIAKLLIMAKADANLKDRDGLKPIDLVFFPYNTKTEIDDHYSREMVKCLLPCTQLSTSDLLLYLKQMAMGLDEFPKQNDNVYVKITIQILRIIHNVLYPFCDKSLLSTDLATQIIRYINTNPSLALETLKETARLLPSEKYFDLILAALSSSDETGTFTVRPEILDWLEFCTTNKNHRISIIGMLLKKLLEMPI